MHQRRTRIAQMGFVHFVVQRSDGLILCASDAYWCHNNCIASELPIVWYQDCKQSGVSCKIAPKLGLKSNNDTVILISPLVYSSVCSLNLYIKGSNPIQPENEHHRFPRS